MFKYFNELLGLLRSINSRLINIDARLIALERCVANPGHGSSFIKTSPHD